MENLKERIQNIGGSEFIHYTVPNRFPFGTARTEKREPLEFFSRSRSVSARRSVYSALNSPFFRSKSQKHEPYRTKRVLIDLFQKGEPFRDYQKPIDSKKRDWANHIGVKNQAFFKSPAIRLAKNVIF